MKSKKGKMNRKGQALTIGDLFPIALTIGVAIFGISILAKVIQTFNDTQSDGSTTWDNSAAGNLTDSGLQAMLDFGDWWTVIVVVAIGAVVIGLIQFFGNRSQ